MTTPPSQFFEDYIDLDASAPPAADEYLHFYSDTNADGPHTTSPWDDDPQDMLSRDYDIREDAAFFDYDQDDLYNGGGGPSTEATTPDTRVSSRSGSSKASRSSKSSKSSAPPVDSASSKKKGKHPRDKEEVQTYRRERFLERNRVAASKCRQKKKEWVNDLEETKTDLESQNSHLQMEYNGLLGEVSRMKTQIMAHAGCNDPNIDKWIENEARRFVQATSDRYDREGRGYPDKAPARTRRGDYPGPAMIPAYGQSYAQTDVSQQLSPISPVQLGYVIPEEKSYKSSSSSHGRGHGRHGSDEHGHSNTHSHSHTHSREKKESSRR